MIRNPNNALLPRKNARQMAYLEAFERQTGKKKIVNSVTRPMLLPGISQEHKDAPCLYLLHRTGNHLSQGFSKDL
jgi:hypothetical protein